jgi:competence protein ComEC
MPWAPVFLSFGIGGYFALPVEPGETVLALTAALAMALAGLALRGPDLLKAPALGIFLIAAGLLLAAERAWSVAEPVLGFRYYGPIEGRIVAIDRSFSDQIRLTLDRVVLQDTEPGRTPAQIRVALHGEDAGTAPSPGTTVILTGHLSPPEGPVEPGGFDFQRLAWFSGLGAVGYTRSPVLALAPPEGGLSVWVFRLRMTISSAIQARIPGQAGAFAAALMTGDRSGVAQATNNALRGSNLSHLISISGLHMGLLTGFVFAACRYGMALVPPVALRFNTKKIAAVLALMAAAFYLMLAGPGVATRRAFIMAAVMLLAVLSDRRAISLRSVAIAAIIVLILEPESLIEPGFQMSFGATVALIVAFRPWARLQPRIPVLLRPVAMLVLSSMAAGLATAPIAAAHFNRIAEYGLLANLVAVPLMGTVVMPAGVIAAVLTPVGLAEPALWVMGQGTAVILAVARWVTSMDGAVIAVPTPVPGVLALLALGGIAALIAQIGWLRIAGGLVFCLALGLWSSAERPVLLISSDGTMAGIMGPDGRALSKPRGAGFVTKSWLEDDGDMALQEQAFARPGFSGKAGALTANIGGTPVGHYFGKGSALRAAGACHQGAYLFLSEPWQGSEPTDCTVYDLTKLRQTGAVALILRHGKLTAVHARDTAGDRLWNRPESERGTLRFGG